MHSTDLELDGLTYTFHHNGDYSGDVICRLPVRDGDHQYVVDGSVCTEVSLIGANVEVRIPFELLKELVGRAMQDEATSAIEGMSGSEFLAWAFDRA